jgi:single-strand DNA-binding protein
MSATIIIPGTLTKDATMRAAGQSQVCSFSVAVNDTVKGEKIATFFDCSLFGSRGDKLCPMLRKGGKVTVVGRLSTREYQGKTYLQCDVNDVTLMGGGQRGAPAESAAPASGGGGYDDADYGAKPEDGDFPF